MVCNFCTIITHNHLHFAKALNRSLEKNLLLGDELNFYVLLVDYKDTTVMPNEGGLNYITIEQLQHLNLANNIIKKYNQDFDKLRWSLKPILLLFLIQKYTDSFIYLDSDLFFYNSYNFFFRYLNDYSILLSPHFRSIEPINNEDEFIKNFTEGIYNGGFIGANLNGMAALNWWASANYFACKKDMMSGLYDDQKYLDILPARFPKTYSLEHEGCNVAAWNRDYSVRVKMNDKIHINGKFPIIFIHFTSGTSIHIKYGSDNNLLPYLIEYAETVDSFNIGIKYFDILEKEYKQSLPKITITYRIQNKLNRIKKYFINNIFFYKR